MMNDSSDFNLFVEGPHEHVHRELTERGSITKGTNKSVIGNPEFAEILQRVDWYLEAVNGLIRLRDPHSMDLSTDRGKLDFINALDRRIAGMVRKIARIGDSIKDFDDKNGIEEMRMFSRERILLEEYKRGFECGRVVSARRRTRVLKRWISKDGSGIEIIGDVSRPFIWKKVVPGQLVSLGSKIVYLDSKKRLNCFSYNEKAEGCHVITVGSTGLVGFIQKTGVELVCRQLIGDKFLHILHANEGGVISVSGRYFILFSGELFPIPTSILLRDGIIKSDSFEESPNQ